MNTFLKIIFLYIPAVFGWIIGILTMLIYFGYIENPNDPNTFNPDDYTPITSYTNEQGTQVTIYANP